MQACRFPHRYLRGRSAGLRQGFYGTGLPAQPAFVSPPLPDIWRCVEATWRQPLKTKATVATWAGILKVEGHSDTESPGVPRCLAAHLLPQTAGLAEGRRRLPALSRDRERLVYLDKIFK